MSVEVPHLAQPFSFSAKGVARVFEQESPENIQARVLRICLCPEGFREDLPQFGIPPLDFQTIPLALEAVAEAVERWEPEATAELIEEALEAANQSSRVVTVEVAP